MKKYLILFVVIVFVSALFGCSMIKKARDRVSLSDISKVSDSKSDDPDVLPKVFNDPEGKFYERELTKARISTLYKQAFSRCQKVMKVHITEGGPELDWRISKDDWGGPDYKYTYKIISIIYKSKDGNCYYEPRASCGKKFDGAKYGPLYCSNSSPQRHKKVNCDVVK